jgi:hypothetical protein
VPQSKRHPARRPQQRTPKSGHRNPSRPSGAQERPPTAPWRRSLERASAGPLLVLHRMPTWLVPVLLAVLLVAGLALSSPVAGVLLLVPAVFLGWLLLLSWPLTSSAGRLLRVIAVLALLGAAVLKLAGRF